MPYLIVANREGELDRRELTGPLTLGRSPDCELCIRDTSLSRHHCRIEALDERWVVTDLGSKNGTMLGNEEPITRHVLRDGDVIRIGRTEISFIDAAFVPPSSNRAPSDSRPADPLEAMSNTVSGFQLFDMEEDARISGFPIPRPHPVESANLHVHDEASSNPRASSTPNPGTVHVLPPMADALRPQTGILRTWFDDAIAELSETWNRLRGQA